MNTPMPEKERQEEEPHDSSDVHTVAHGDEPVL